MAYTLRYTSELRNQSDYFRDIKSVEIGEESLELAESLIAKRSAKLDLSKFEDGYEVALKELVDAKINHLPVPQDEGQQPRRGNVVNLMDALRKSLGSAAAPAPFCEEAGRQCKARTEEGNWSGQIIREACNETEVGLASKTIYDGLTVARTT